MNSAYESDSYLQPLLLQTDLSKPPQSPQPPPARGSGVSGPFLCPFAAASIGRLGGGAGVSSWSRRTHFRAGKAAQSGCCVGRDPPTPPRRLPSSTSMEVSLDTPNSDRSIDVEPYLIIAPREARGPPLALTSPDKAHGPHMPLTSPQEARYVSLGYEASPSGCRHPCCADLQRSRSPTQPTLSTFHQPHRQSIQRKSHHNETQSHHNETQSHHNETRSNHNQPQIHHNETQSHHNETQSHHNETQSHHNETQCHHTEKRSNHNQPQIQHNQTQSHHNQTQSHHNQTQSHHNQTQSHHNQTQSHHNQTQSHHNQTQSYHNETQSHHNQPQIHHNETQSNHNQPQIQHNQPQSRHPIPPPRSQRPLPKPHLHSCASSRQSSSLTSSDANGSGLPYPPPPPPPPRRSPLAYEQATPRPPLEDEPCPFRAGLAPSGLDSPPKYGSYEPNHVFSSTRKIKVTQINKLTTLDQFFDYFSQFGDIHDCRLMLQDFVKVFDSEDPRKSIDFKVVGEVLYSQQSTLPAFHAIFGAKNHILDSHALDVSLLFPYSPFSSYTSLSLATDLLSSSSRVFVGGVALGARFQARNLAQYLDALFSQFGDVLHVRVSFLDCTTTTTATSAAAAAAIVTFKQAAAAAAAVRSAKTAWNVRLLTSMFELVESPYYELLSV